MLVTLEKLIGFHLDEGSLIEEYPDLQVKYGRWDQAFSCRILLIEAGRQLDWVPDWPLMNNDGGVLEKLPPRDFPNPVVEPKGDPVSISRDTSKYEICVYFPKNPAPSSISAVSDYLSLIPEHIRKLTAPFGAFQWLALDAIWQEPKFVDFITAELDEFGPAYLMATWSLRNSFSTPAGERRALNLQIAGEARLDLLASLIGRSSAQVFLHALSVLNSENIVPYLFEELSGCLEDQEKILALTKTRSLTNSKVTALRDAPPWLCEPDFLNYLPAESHGYIEVIRCFEKHRDLPTKFHEEIRRSFQKACEIDGNYAQYEDWLYANFIERQKP